MQLTRARVFLAWLVPPARPFPSEALPKLRQGGDEAEVSAEVPDRGADFSGGGERVR